MSPAPNPNPIPNLASSEVETRKRHVLRKFVAELVENVPYFGRGLLWKEEEEETAGKNEAVIAAQTRGFLLYKCSEASFKLASAASRLGGSSYLEPVAFPAVAGFFPELLAADATASLAFSTALLGASLLVVSHSEIQSPLSHCFIFSSC